MGGFYDISRRKLAIFGHGSDEENLVAKGAGFSEAVEKLGKDVFISGSSELLKNSQSGYLESRVSLRIVTRWRI